MSRFQWYRKWKGGCWAKDTYCGWIQIPEVNYLKFKRTLASIGDGGSLEDWT